MNGWFWDLLGPIGKTDMGRKAAKAQQATPPTLPEPEDAAARSAARVFVELLRLQPHNA
jgi:hypothetical protein